MDNYRIHYRDYYGEYNQVTIHANTQSEAIERFEYEYGDCKFLHIS